MVCADSKFCVLCLLVVWRTFSKLLQTQRCVRNGGAVKTKLVLAVRIETFQLYRLHFSELLQQEIKSNH